MPHLRFRNANIANSSSLNNKSNVIVPLYKIKGTFLVKQNIQMERTFVTKFDRLF